MIRFTFFTYSLIAVDHRTANGSEGSPTEIWGRRSGDSILNSPESSAANPLILRISSCCRQAFRAGKTSKNGPRPTGVTPHPDQPRSASQTRGQLSFPDDWSHGAAGHRHPMRCPTPTTSIEHKHTILPYPIYRPIQPTRHFVGALRNLTTDAQHFVSPDVGRGCDPLQHLLPGRAPHILKDLLHQSIVVWRSITPLVVPCVLRFTAIGGLKLRNCGHPCHNCLLAYHPNVYFAA